MTTTNRLMTTPNGELMTTTNKSQIAESMTITTTTPNYDDYIFDEFVRAAPRTGRDPLEEDTCRSLRAPGPHSVAPAHAVPVGDTTVLSSAKIPHEGARCPRVRSDPSVCQPRRANTPKAALEIGPSTSATKDLGAACDSRSSVQMISSCTFLNAEPCLGQTPVEHTVEHTGWAKGCAYTEDPAAPTLAEKLRLK